MPPPIVVMGVSGSGKSTIGRALAQRLTVDFEDGDDLHPAENIAKMAAGEPLTDHDRVPWLDAVGSWLDQHREGGVIACSALKRVYRDRLREAASDTVFLHLDGDPSVLIDRVTDRPDHFMPASLLASQLSTLERLQDDEPGLTVDFALPVDRIIDRVLDHLQIGANGAY